MRISPIKICIIQPSANLDGSAFSGLLLANGLKAHGYTTCVWFAHAGPMLERYRSAGHEVMVVPHKSWLRTDRICGFIKNFVQEIATARRMQTALIRKGVDVVYVNSVVSLAGAIAGKRAGLPVVWHLRELYTDVGGEMCAPKLFRSMIRRIVEFCSNRCVSISEAVTNNLMGERYRHALIIPNAGGPDYDHLLDLDTSDLRVEMGIPANSMVLGVPGTLRPMKGHSFLLAALPAVVSRYPELSVLIPGGGEVKYLQELEALVERNGLAQNVHFLGSISEMTRFYGLCDIVCIPSRAEPFGRTVIESMAYQLPVVATRVGGIPEIIDDGVNGILVEYNDKRALSDSIFTLIESKDERGRLGLAAREKYFREFQTSVYQEKIFQVVSTLIEDG